MRNELRVQRHSVTKDDICAGATRVFRFAEIDKVNTPISIFF